MTVALDYVEHGEARWPEKSRLDKAMRFFSVYLESIQGDEDKLIELLDAFGNWHRPGLTFTFVLDIVGNTMLKQARPAGFDDEQYRLLLLARTLVRVSEATEADVQRVLDYLSRINGGTGNYNATSGPPEHWTIAFFGLTLTPQWTELYLRLIFDTIGATDSFTLSFSSNAAALYDDENAIYDVSLYD